MAAAAAVERARAAAPRGEADSEGCPVDRASVMDVAVVAAAVKEVALGDMVPDPIS